MKMMLLPKCFLVLCLALCGHSLDLGDTPMQNPDLFGGDMLGIEDIVYDERSGIVNLNQRWPGGKVPYEIDPGLSNNVRNRIIFSNSFSYFKKDTCVEFIPHTNETDYIRIFSGEGCYSHVGRTGGVQPLSIGPGCDYQGTIIHELIHALGFYHEQNRSDRDEYLIIYWDNIKEGLTDQFFKLKPEQNELFNAFDYQSIMLYGDTAFSKDKRTLKTMAAKQAGVKLRDVLSKYWMSSSDVWRINKLYECKKV